MTLVAASVLVVAAGSGLLVGTTSVALLPAQMEYERCQVSAVTISGQQTCAQTYDDAVARLQKQLTGLPLRP